MPADILIVAATLVSALALSSVVAGWAARTLPAAGLAGLAAGAALFGWAYQTSGGLGWMDIPDSFILVAARILN